MQIVYFKNDEEPELSYKSQEALLSKLVENVIQEAAKIQDGDIDVILVDNREVFNFWNAPDGCLGFHAINSGYYEHEDNDFLSAKHRVVMLVNEEEFRRHFEGELAKDLSDYRHEYLDAYLVTVTHELTHCLELIEHANGMTPSEVQNAFDAEDIDLDLHDLCAGHGILFEFDENLSEEELTEIMEERVEQKGREWYNQLILDKTLYNAVIEQFTPQDFYEEQGLR